MAYVELTPLQKNSLPAKTTSLLADDGVSVEVDDQSVFYRGGSLLTKGWVLGPDNAVDSYTEEITVSATDATTGAGTVTISARAIKADGTNGAAREWPIGTTIKNTYSTSTHDQIRDNLIAHATLITARATKTTAAMSVYVDKAATGAGTGVDWDNAFTTIMGAIESLPNIVSTAITIRIRKSDTSYPERVIVPQIAGGGSISIEGEYYWNGNIVEAGTPSATVFRVTSDTASSIAAGDAVFITNGHTAALLSTVASTAFVSGTTYEVTINAPTYYDATWGNLSSTDYYTITKTVIIPSGGWSSKAVPLSVTGLSFDTATSVAFTPQNLTSMTIQYVIVSGAKAAYNTTNANVFFRSCALNATGAGTYNRSFGDGTITFGAYGYDPYACFIRAMSYSINPYNKNCVNIYNSIVGGGTSETAVYCMYACVVNILNTTILANTTYGIQATRNSLVVQIGGVVNNATTAKVPASGQTTPATYPWDYSYIAGSP
jgi:hypothetical protein